MPSEDNPADLASRGGDVQQKELLWNGLEWMGNPKDWPPVIASSPFTESQEETKVNKAIFAGATETSDQLDLVLEKYELTKAIGIMSWITRFIYNCQHPNDVKKGPLLTGEITSQHVFWTKRAQESSTNEQDRKIYSDNGTTFVGAANSLKKETNDEKLNHYLVENKITWQF